MRTDRFIPVMLSAAFLAVCFTQSGTAAEPTVKLTQKDSNVEVSIDGNLFTVLNFSKEQRKPYFHPVNGPDGTFISRPLENPSDHPHHKGLWFSVDEVNKSRHWMERSPIEPGEVKILQAEGNPAKLEMTSIWKADDGRDLLSEKTTVSIFANRLIIYDAILKAEKEPVEFEDTKEGMFAFRFRDELREKVGGHVSNADGLQTTKECWGKESDWVDYYGTVEGTTAGVALFDHPLNFHRSRYHVRDYGLFAINPFGQHAYTNGALPKDPIHLPTGTFVRLRYGAYIHSGNTDEGKVKEAYQQFLKNS
ncbi:MAG: PmoA family protein [Planctomycetaceae bacterium]|nr:PmoA family protein [Planctomycetaceae bacterium]